MNAMWRWSSPAYVIFVTDSIEEKVNDTDLTRAKSAQGNPGRRLPPPLIALPRGCERKAHFRRAKADHVSIFQDRRLHGFAVHIPESSLLDRQHDRFTLVNCQSGMP